MSNQTTTKGRQMNTKFSPGDSVTIIATGQTGTVAHIDAGGYVLVDYPDGLATARVIVPVSVLRMAEGEEA